LKELVQKDQGGGVFQKLYGFPYKGKEEPEAIEEEY